MMKRERLWNSLYVILTIIVLLLIMTIPHIVMCNMQHSINQRLGGAFMKKLWIITMVITLSLLLTSCQPTPETPVVVGKGDGRLEDKIIDSTQNTSAPEGEVLDFGTPEKYTDEFSNNSGKLTVHVDAPITVPQVSSLPVIKVSPRTITQEEADTLVSLLFQGKPLLATDNQKELTVQDLQNLIIQNKAAAAIEKDSAQKQRILDSIAELEAQLKTALQSIESGESTTTLQGSGGQTGIDIFCNLGNLNPAHIYINNTAESRALASCLLYTSDAADDLL